MKLLSIVQFLNVLMYKYFNSFLNILAGLPNDYGPRPGQAGTQRLQMQAVVSLP